MIQECPEKYRELSYEEIEEKISQLSICGKHACARKKALLDSGNAKSGREAERIISEELNKPLGTIRRSIWEEENKQKMAQSEPEEIVNNSELPPLPASCKPHVSFNAGNNEWYTPAEYIDAAYAVMGEIDLDPASSEIANQTVGAKKYFTIEDDGLKMDWYGNVWMNPPYASDLIGRFCTKLVYHAVAGDIKDAIVLVNNATETNWFYSLIEIASAVVFTKGRVRFLDPEGNPGAPLQGQAIIYIGENINSFIDNFSEFGWVAEICH